MYKLQMQTPNLTSQNIDKIAALFPNCITEMLDEEKSTPDRKVYKRGINFELLKQMLSPDVVDGDEAYEFTWVGKKASIVEANKPTRKTLRPCPEESKNWDDTENLYIEGDNLEVLKLLQESYLGKVKMIYIDPPYNTGNDFIYADDFMRSQDEENRQMGMYDEDENRLFKNNDSNGRFHSDWCSMMYSRLMLARNLLTDDGVIFISIDDNEQVNLSKICDEVFGAGNRIGPIIQNKQNAKNDTVNIQKNHEFILVYRKSTLQDGTNIKATLKRSVTVYRDVFEENGRFFYLNDPITTRGEGGTLNARPNLGYTIYYNPATKDFKAEMDYDVELAKKCNNEEEVYSPIQTLMCSGYVAVRPPHVRGKLGCWTWSIDKFRTEKDNIIITGKNGSFTARKRTFVDGTSVQKKDGKLVYTSTTDANSRSILDFSTNEGTNELNSLIDGNIFNNPKNLEMLKYFIELVRDSNMIILDFFSGSATTAHAVMQLNAKDNGHRKFIMVQLPEPCDEKSAAYKAGYKTICDIGKERIRRAGEKIKQEDDCWKCVPLNRMDGSKPGDDTTAKIVKTIDAGDGKPPIEMVDISKNPDVGFRVFKLDDTNMKDVYYSAEEYSQTNLEDLESNIKEDRTDLDLLFGCLLDWGLPLSMPYRSEKIGNCTVHTYAPGDAALNVPDALIACFDSNVPENVIKEIAKRKPRRAVFRDSSFASSPEKINVFEIFKLYAQDTDVKVI